MSVADDQYRYYAGMGIIPDRYTLEITPEITEYASRALAEYSTFYVPLSVKDLAFRAYICCLESQDRTSPYAGYSIPIVNPKVNKRIPSTIPTARNFPMLFIQGSAKMSYAPWPISTYTYGSMNLEFPYKARCCTKIEGGSWSFAGNVANPTPTTTTFNGLESDDEIQGIWDGGHPSDWEIGNTTSGRYDFTQIIPLQEAFTFSPPIPEFPDGYTFRVGRLGNGFINRFACYSPTLSNVYQIIVNGVRYNLPYSLTVNPASNAATPGTVRQVNNLTGGLVITNNLDFEQFYPDDPPDYNGVDSSNFKSPYSAGTVRYAVPTPPTNPPNILTPGNLEVKKDTTTFRIKDYVNFTQ